MIHLRGRSAEERRKIYNELLESENVGADVRMGFFWRDDVQPMLKGYRVDGHCYWVYRPWRPDDTGCYSIGVQEKLPLRVEVETLAHELSHIRLGHVPKVPRGYDHAASEQATAELFNGELGEQRRSQAIAREEATDREAEKILSEWRAAGLVWE